MGIRVAQNGGRTRSSENLDQNCEGLDKTEEKKTMNDDVIRIAPKPTERPTQVGAIFSSQLNLTPEKSRPKQVKESRVDAAIKQAVFVENHENDENYPSLERPVINSSARITNKLHDLQKNKFKPAIAIAEELENSEAARTNFAEKVSQAVNIKRDKNKYSDLISLDVVPRDVIKSHVLQRAPCTAKPGKGPDVEPQIMDFYSEDFEEESAKFDFNGLDEKDELPVVSYDYAFDLYSHMRCWEHSWR